MTRKLLPFALVVLAFALSSCGSDGSEGASDVDVTRQDGEWTRGPDGVWRQPDTGSSNNSPAFNYNGEVCKIGPMPQSAVISKVEAGTDRLDAFAARLADEGYDVHRGPEATVIADPGGDILQTPGDIVTRETVDSLPELTDAVSVLDLLVEDIADVVQEPAWTGGEYLIARTPLSDLIFVLDDGTIGVVSWCPAYSLGQIRRLDYTLADAIRFFGDIAAYDYATETNKWTQPVTYYTAKAGMYQRSYMNDSLSVDEKHDGQVSITGKPMMAGFALYGHADAPSQVGDVVGMDLLQVGQKVLAENDTVTVTGQVVRLWDFSPLAGEGEVPVVVDAYVSDESIDWQVGVYSFFADVIFPESANGSFVLSLQGAPPGKLMVSKAVGTLVLPPLSPLF
jgi:hypothetical protein